MRRHLNASNKALELDPRCAWAWNNKIIALNRLRRYNEASECSNKSSELNPTTIPNW